MYLQSTRVKDDLKYLVDATLTMINERRHQKTEFKVMYSLFTYQMEKHTTFRFVFLTEHEVINYVIANVHVYVVFNFSIHVQIHAVD